MKTVCVLTLIVAAASAASVKIVKGTAAGSVKVDVYYESLCPDSRNFLVNQLAANWADLGSSINLRLIPFGKASFTATNEGGWAFECQHGPEECAGNILHACGIKYSDNPTNTVAYTSCLMLNPGAGQQCAAQAGLDFTPIKQCQNSLEGQQLLHDHGVETLGLKPKVTFIPWIIFNGVYDEQNEWNAQLDFKTTACNNIIGDKPATCFTFRKG